MRTSPHGVELISSFEGLRLQAYQDAVGVWTIGYGHTRGVRKGMKITKAQAIVFLRDDLRNAEAAVNRLGLTFNINEFDALVSLVFNCGAGAISPTSTIGRALRRNDRKAAARGFLLWVKAGKPLHTIPGLITRRWKERALFLTPAPVIKPGRNMTTKELQSALRAVGWPLRVDGKLGPKTKEAIRDFQLGYVGFGGAYTKRPLAVDGVAGRRTQGALRYCITKGGRASPHFAFREFASSKTGWIKVHRELIAGLEKLRAKRGGKPIGVLSGYRDFKLGASNSQHHYGNAMDPTAPLGSVELVRSLRVFSGIGFDGHGVRHVDVRHVGPSNTTGGTPSRPTVFRDSF